MTDHQIHAGPRRTLPNRRRSEARKVTWTPPHNLDAPETKIYITIGYDDDGLRPVEIFYDGGYRSGSDLETLVRDLCIVLSVLIQHQDIKIETFTASLARELDLRTSEKSFGSLVGVLIEQLSIAPQWAEQLAAQDCEVRDD
jgi:hypothetical protein